MSATLEHFIPAVRWLRAYRRADLTGDITAGIITAILLIPQAMAYSVLAGLPPEIGLYASIAPPMLYALFGSSRALAVGPVAVASLMVAAAVGAVAVPGTAEYYAAALILALMIGLILLVLGIARLGFVANFLSHPVMAGFTSAAAIVIAISQLKHLLGLSPPRTESVDGILLYLARHLGDANVAAIAIGAGSIFLLLMSRRYLEAGLAWLPLPKAILKAGAKAGPLFVVAAMTGLAATLNLEQAVGLNVVGAIPAGLPPLTVPDFALERWLELAPSAALIALVSFVESVAIAQFLASKRRQKIDVNRELTGLGIANIGAAFTGGSPVCGGFRAR